MKLQPPSPVARLRMQHRSLRPAGRKTEAKRVITVTMIRWSSAMKTSKCAVPARTTENDDKTTGAHHLTWRAGVLRGRGGIWTPKAQPKRRDGDDTECEPADSRNRQECKEGGSADKPSEPHSRRSRNGSNPTQSGMLSQRPTQHGPTCRTKTRIKEADSVREPAECHHRWES